MDQSDIKKYRIKFEDELFNHVLPFWETHSPDPDYGGYFNCLDCDGTVYDTRKHVWLQGRQVWMFSKLYNTVEPRESWLTMAKSGMEFLEQNAVRKENRRVYFCLNRKGDPIWMQRKIFSECFYVMALSEYGRAVDDQSYIKRAREHFNTIWSWKDDLSKVGRPSYSGQKKMNALAVPMILLNVIEEIAGDDWSAWQVKIDECIRQMLLHVHSDRKLVFENVSPDGEFLNTIEGRLLNPGHAIEAGWFLQHWAQKLNDQSLSNTATLMVRWSLDRGWDDEHGGIFYFLDSEGYSPTELEWNLKLWWPHTEALYGSLLNHYITKSEDDLEDFERVFDYTFSHYPDHDHGGWFGYLDRYGHVSQRFKGGPYKGFFHVPRSLLFCRNLLMTMDKQDSTTGQS